MMYACIAVQCTFNCACFSDAVVLMLEWRVRSEGESVCLLYRIAGNFHWVLFSFFFRYGEPPNEKLTHENLDI